MKSEREEDQINVLLKLFHGVPMPRKKKEVLTVPDMPKEELERLEHVSDDALFFELKRRRIERAEAMDGEILYVKKTIKELETQLIAMKSKRRQLEAQKAEFTRAI